jgi:hypothetical protein
MLARLRTGRRGAPRIRRALAGAALAGAGAVALTSCYPSSSGGMLYRLRMCETGGNYGMHTWVGGIEYGGGYGFDVRIWRAQGNAPDPQYASPAKQDAVELSDIALLGVHRSNPGCAAKLGL